jgi:hypothetical protein
MKARQRSKGFIVKWGSLILFPSYTSQGLEVPEFELK